MVRDTILAMDVNNHGYTQNDAVLISKMWHHPLIRKTYERRGEYWLLESANYYLDHAIRFADGVSLFPLQPLISL